MMCPTQRGVVKKRTKELGGKGQEDSVKNESLKARPHQRGGPDVTPRKKDAGT